MTFKINDLYIDHEQKWVNRVTNDENEIGIDLYPSFLFDKKRGILVFLSNCFVKERIIAKYKKI